MLTTVNGYKILKVFFECPEKSFHIRRLAKLTKLSPPGVLKIVKQLKKEGFVLVEKGNVTEDVKASKTDRFLRLKVFYNLEQLFETGLIDYLREIYKEPEAIVLFGSYSNGEDISTSDIDMAIVAPKERDTNLAKFEKKLKKKINLYTVQPRKAEPEFLNSLANGRVLYGFLRVI